ncbi:hypothetical protein CHS0354_015600 [Potamilus streckersoni]|uniref:Uncharacterized protein n=1 Tax=Potamilus streckersoni TaxID=2493646 RepID=A0AAE0WAI5_9BIVA|nr:hypothetical protein CHS0354_015600 [Potamilus streckersoni]
MANMRRSRSAHGPHKKKGNTHHQIHARLSATTPQKRPIKINISISGPTTRRENPTWPNMKTQENENSALPIAHHATIIVHPDNWSNPTRRKTQMASTLSMITIEEAFVSLHASTRKENPKQIKDGADSPNQINNTTITLAQIVARLTFSPMTNARPSKPYQYPKQDTKATTAPP